MRHGAWVPGHALASAAAQRWPASTVLALGCVFLAIFLVGALLIGMIRPDDRARKLAARIERYGASHAWLAAEREGKVVGYAYATPFNERPAYRWSTSVSVYIAEEAHGEGVGRALYGALFDRLRERGFRMACAGITLPNEASVGLHESLGFELVGVNREIGWKEGAWRDVGWYQLELSPAPAGTPPEPRPSV